MSFCTACASSSGGAGGSFCAVHWLCSLSYLSWWRVAASKLSSVFERSKIMCRELIRHGLRPSVAQLRDGCVFASVLLDASLIICSPEFCGRRSTNTCKTCGRIACQYGPPPPSARCGSQRPRRAKPTPVAARQCFTGEEDGIYRRRGRDYRFTSIGPPRDAP